MHRCSVSCSQKIPLGIWVSRRLESWSRLWTFLRCKFSPCGSFWVSPCDSAWFLFDTFLMDGSCRIILTGLCYLATFFFGANLLGLTLYAPFNCCKVKLRSYWADFAKVSHGLVAVLCSVFVSHSWVEVSSMRQRSPLIVRLEDLLGRHQFWVDTSLQEFLCRLFKGVLL